MNLDIANLTISLNNSNPDLFIKIVPIIISLFALGFSIFSWVSNRNITLKNEFIKRESNVLLQFREDYLKAQASFIWFKDWLLTPRIYEHRVQEEFLEVKVSELEYHLNLINKLNETYNLNQHIFAKHNLVYECECIEKFMKVFHAYYFGKFQLYKQKRDDNLIEYRAGNYDKIVRKFIETFDDVEITEKKKKKYEEKYKNLKEKIYNVIGNMEFKLDNITLYNTNPKTNKRTFSKKVFYPYFIEKEKPEFYGAEEIYNSENKENND